jgi:hypothetical protein
MKLSTLIMQTRSAMLGRFSSQSALLWAFACIVPMAYADGEPDLSFGTGSFVVYDAGVKGEPQIERGLCIQRTLVNGPESGFAVLMQNNFNPSASTESVALLTRFDNQGNFLSQSRPGVRIDHTLGALMPCHALPAITPQPMRFALASVLDGPSAKAGRVQQNNSAAPFPATLELDYLELGPSALYSVVQNAAGDMLACGALLFGGVNRAYCRKWDSTNTLLTNFGNSSPFGSAGQFVFDNALLARTRFTSVQFDAQGRILLAGLGAQATGASQLLTVRLTSNGQLDSSFCASNTCANALASAPGWRLDAATASSSVSNALILERADGRIAIVAGTFGDAPNPARLALNIFEASGANHYANSFAVGGLVSLGTGLTTQADGKILVPLSYRDSVQSFQLGAIWRIPRNPAQSGLIDATFGFAPSGTTAIPGLSIIRPTLSGVPASSVECNGLMLTETAATCVGLVRVSSTPVNLDLLMARVQIQLDPNVFSNGFE